MINFGVKMVLNDVIKLVVVIELFNGLIEKIVVGDVNVIVCDLKVDCEL